MIFLSEEDTPLLEEPLPPLSEGEVVVGVEVESITVALVIPLIVTSEVMVLTTGVWLVEVVSAAVVLSTVLEVEGSLDEEVDVGVVDGGSDEEEVVDVVCVLVVLGAWEVEEVDDVDEVVLGAEVCSEDELLVVEEVRSPRRLEGSAL
jgi:hypothetical protein